MMESQKEAWNICAELKRKYLELRERYEFLLKAYREMCCKQDPEADARSVSARSVNASEGDGTAVELLSGRVVVGEYGGWRRRRSRPLGISSPRSRRSRRGEWRRWRGEWRGEWRRRRRRWRRGSSESGRAGGLKTRVTLCHRVKRCKSGLFVGMDSLCVNSLLFKEVSVPVCIILLF